MWEPLLPSQPPWSLGGQWKIGECGKSLCLRHWKHLGIIFTSGEPAGGESFLGRVLWEQEGWYVLGAFGSQQPAKGRLSIGASTASIKWPTGSTWAQEQEEWEPPLDLGQRRVRAVLVTILVLLAPCAILQVYRLIVANVFIGGFTVVHAVLVFRVMPWCSMLAPPGAKGGYLWMCCILAVISLMALIVAAAVVLALNCWPPLFSHVYLALMTLTLLCSLLCGIWARAMEAMANAQNPEEWPGVVKIPFSHGEHSRVVQAFESACSQWQHMYPFSLEVVEVYSVSNLLLSAKFAESHSALSSELHITQLYHGTSASSAKAIIANGFLSPLRAFGRPTSFSEMPLKSWQYTAKTGGNYILLCDVALGLPKSLHEEAGIWNHESLQSIFGGKVGCDSMLALRYEDGGVLRIPARQVPRPEQALPTFLLRVREKPIPVD
mmetsp:Transcript_10834/g.32639  ORF Transcript_10834/g.32639 Transcript_10834/m.32639 type:complete len:436 (-) Transcript_10834:30-1337(-)